MNAKILTTPEIDQVCRLLCSPYYNTNEFARHFFSDLYLTGCRPSELLSRSRWLDTGSQYELTTAKTGEKRIIDKNLLSGDFKLSYYQNRSPYYQLTYDQLTLIFRQKVSVHPICTEKKIVDTYIFRYNRARLMYEQTKDLQEVMKFFGWQSPAICAAYISRPLYYKPNLLL
jgi:hypothetical protein